MRKIIIAIDGLSGCGKSTTAKGAARKLNYTYIDSGAMYRAVTLFFILEKVNFNDPYETQTALEKIHLRFKKSDKKEDSDMYLNGSNVEEQIRSMDVSNLVSEVSRIPSVRHKMVDLQREMGEEGGIVMDGRDIGTNVFPNADLKYFVTAKVDVRVRRRLKELEAKGEVSSFEEVKENLVKRDRIDQSRKENPLIQAEDALVMDTTDMTIEEQIDTVVNKAIEKINS